MVDNKVECMLKAKEYEFDYWDGDRRYGYGGYKYDGRWKSVAEKLIATYQLPPNARILDVEPNEERLLSYAVDLGTEVNPVPSSDNGRLTLVKVNKGILYSTTKVRETKTYTIVNRNDAERLVLIEHPVRNQFELKDTDKPAETASDFYRFQVKVAPGKTEKQVVTEEHVINSSVNLTNLDDNNIRIFVVRSSLKEVRVVP
jgi:hypothetical protein